MNVEFECFIFYLLTCSFLATAEVLGRVGNPMLSEVYRLNISSKKPGLGFRIFGSKKG